MVLFTFLFKNKDFLFIILRLYNDEIANTIIATSSDYLGDLAHLRNELEFSALFKWYITLKAEYMKAFFQKYLLNTILEPKFKKI